MTARRGPVAGSMVVCLIMAVAFACSSTKTQRSGVSDRSSDVAAPAPGATRDGVSATDGVGSDVSPTGDGSRATNAGGGAPVAAPVAGSAVRKLTGGTLKLGVHLSANAAAAAAFGVSLPAHSPEKVDAIVKWINAHGGIGGRRVEPLYHTTDPLEGSFDQQAQEACTDLAQDKKVAYAISGAQLYRDSLPACFAKNRTPLVWNVFYPTQPSIVAPEWLYRPAQPHTDRLGFVIDGLVKHGFFRGARIGIVRYDSAKAKAISDGVLKPALARHGLKVAAESGLREPDSAAQASDTAASASSSVLKFRQERITHVVFVPSGGAIPLLYLAAAESQGYRPRYGFSSLDAPYFVRDSVPRTQLEGAAGVGWSPTVDLGPERREAQNFSSGSKLCIAIAKGAGFGPEEAPIMYCDMLFFLRAALDGVRSVTSDALAAAVPNATGYQSSLTFGTRFTTARHDGTAKARIFVYDGDWTYVGAPYAI